MSGTSKRVSSALLTLPVLFSCQSILGIEAGTLHAGACLTDADCELGQGCSELQLCVAITTGGVPEGTGGAAGGTGGTTITGGGAPPEGGGGATEDAMGEVVCRANQAACDGNRATTCNDQATGFVTEGTNCGAERTCLQGACIDRECASGERYCSGRGVRSCAEDGLSSTVAETCAQGEYCDVEQAACRSGVCAPNEPSCDGNRATTCDSEGAGFLAGGAECAEGTTCDAGECIEQLCIPGSAYCLGQDLKQCSDDGLSSSVEETCEGQTCVESSGSASCEGVCEPLDQECDGAYEVRSCGADGQWGEPTACDSATACSAAGQCLTCADGSYTGADGCSPWSDCEPGQFIAASGTATADTLCGACESGTYSETTNAESCTEWTACTGEDIEDEPGSATQDRTCRTGSWTRQFGSSSPDQGRGVAVDGDGNIFVTGYVGAELPNQSGVGSRDAFVRKYDATGADLWTRQFGTAGLEQAHDVAVDSDGRVYATGYIVGTATLPGQSGTAADDAWVRSYDGDGVEGLTLQFGTGGGTGGRGVAVDGTGNIYVAGRTLGAFAGSTFSGGTWDAFVVRYTGSGELGYARQFGTGGTTEANDVAVTASGISYVVGVTTGTLPDQTPAGGSSDAFVRRYNAGGFPEWVRQFGTDQLDEAYGVAIDSGGNVYVAGLTAGTFLDQASPNGAANDVFLRKYDSDGDEQWTVQLAAPDAASEGAAVSVDADGNVYVTGHTWGALPEQMGVGGSDGFVTGFDGNGNRFLTVQLGTSEAELGDALAVDRSGVIYFVGSTTGELPGQASSLGQDVFLARIVR